MSLLQQKRNAAGEVVTLYAVAAEVYDPKTKEWIADICHMHAKDAPNARLMYTASMFGRRFRIAGIAPAIGFKVADEHGDKLIA